jgi:transcriptional regulator with XRE-family HTH domain
MMTSFGKYIRKLRIERGLTLTQLAAQLNLDSANLSKIENGKRTLNENRLEKLSHALKVDLSTIKSEFYSDYIAQKLYDSDCLSETLILTEKKVKYLIQHNGN